MGRVGSGWQRWCLALCIGSRNAGANDVRGRCDLDAVRRVRANFTNDGHTVFFNRSVPRSNLYFICTSTFRDGHWTAPEVAPFSGRYWDFDAVVSPDGSQMFFSSDRPVPGRTKTDQDFDIWVMDKKGAAWGEPRHVDDTVNSDADETFASVAANGTLYFVSGREGGRAHLALYRSRLLNGHYQRRRS